MSLKKMMKNNEPNNDLCGTSDPIGYEFGKLQNGTYLKMETVIFTDYIRQYVDKGNLVGAVLIVLAKVFDTISVKF